MMEIVEINRVNKQIVLAVLRDIWLQMSKTPNNVKLPRVFPPVELHQSPRPWDKRTADDVIEEVANKNRPLLVSVYPPAYATTDVPLAEQVHPAISIIAEVTKTGVIVIIDLIDEPYPLTLVLYRQLIARLRAWAVEQEHSALNSPSQQRSGSPGRHSHRAAIKRLNAGEDKELNFKTWRHDYKKETGIDPDYTASGAQELYRKSVLERIRK
jgi:hypothetical protein